VQFNRFRRRKEEDDVVHVSEAKGRGSGEGGVKEK
jgi:hypothetical protein